MGSKVIASEHLLLGLIKEGDELVQELFQRSGVNAELHVFSKGAHGFGLGAGRGKSVAMWPTSFAAWLGDSNMIQD